MNDKLRDALEEWRNSGGFHACDQDSCFNAVYTLAAAFVEGQACDDDEPVDRAFVSTLGKSWRDDADCVIRQLMQSNYLSVQVLWESDWTKKKWRCVVRIYGKGIAGAGIVECATRGAVRRLLAALGVTPLGQG